MNFSTTFLTIPLSQLTLACLSAQYAWANDTPQPIQLPTLQSQATATAPYSWNDAAIEHFPATKAQLNAAQIQQKTNVMNTEDAFKYLPSLLVRKRFIGDTQAPLATRTTGINASARTLIYADGLLLSTLINNNNGNGSPQWFMVAPEEIAKVDVLYGPYSAAFAGNSYGAVANMVTKMPQDFQASLSLKGALQNAEWYNSKDHYGSGQASLFMGDKTGDLSWTFSANHLDSNSQPVTIATIAQSTNVAAANLAVVNGAIADKNRTGGAIQVLGAGNLTHTIQDNLKLKLAYDLSPTLTAKYIIGFWQNNAKTRAESYLSTVNAGVTTPYYGATSGNVNIGGYSYSASSIAGQFTSTQTEQQHLMQGLQLKNSSDTGLSWDLSLSHFDYLKDLSRQSRGVYTATRDGGTGQITDAKGTGWSTADLTASKQLNDAHLLSVGLHADWYRLDSETYNSSNWLGNKELLNAASKGKTQTQALWAQDVWRLTPQISSTLGLRYEQWQASNGFNLSTASNGTVFPVNQPKQQRNGLSPKAAIAWEFAPTWQVSTATGRALRFPTVGELYQNVQTGTTFTQANPNLKPENVWSTELALSQKVDAYDWRLSLFQEQVKNALISQTTNIAGFATPVSYVQNVDKTRQRGAELAGSVRDWLIEGLELNGSVTYVNAKILKNSSYVATVAGATSAGKHTPYVPDWRATLGATYQITPQWDVNLAGRYVGRQYATVDNSDINPKTYQGFQPFWVMDVRSGYRVNEHMSVAMGIDNLNNDHYYLFHPFPERTLYGELKLTY